MGQGRRRELAGVRRLLNDGNPGDEQRPKQPQPRRMIQNHITTKAERELWRLSSPMPLHKAASPRAGVSEPCPVRF